MLDAQLEAGGLSGPALTVADMYLGVLLRWARLYPAEHPPLESLDAWPRVHALCRRIEDRPAAARAFAAEAVPAERAITAPRPPDVPAAEVTA